MIVFCSKLADTQNLIQITLSRQSRTTTCNDHSNRYLHLSLVRLCVVAQASSEGDSLNHLDGLGTDPLINLQLITIFRTVSDVNNLNPIGRRGS